MLPIPSLNLPVASHLTSALEPVCIPAQSVAEIVPLSGLVPSNAAQFSSKLSADAAVFLSNHPKRIKCERRATSSTSLEASHRSSHRASGLLACSSHDQERLPCCPRFQQGRCRQFAVNSGRKTVLSSPGSQKSAHKHPHRPLARSSSVR